MPHPSEERDRGSAARVAELRELCAEIQAAISALASDDLKALEASVENQEKLADRLQNLFQPGQFLNRVSAVPAEALELIQLTRVYSALLQRSMRTSRLRAVLCRSYRQHFATSGEPASANTWSCEV